MTTDAPAVRGPVARWVEGARPKTLPAAMVPVLVGAALSMVLHRRMFWTTSAPLGSGIHPFPATTIGLRFPTWLQVDLDHLNWVRLGLTVVVALALQVGVNYANDCSDGVKGTDANRVGPLRLVGSGLVPAATVKRAAFLCFGVAAVAGLALAAATSWWLLAIGATAILSAWGYTGGPKPYGYLGLGELFVFVFFGLVATLGTVYLQTGGLPAAAWPAAVAVGFSSVALLEANNLRDVTGDTAANKRTLAVRLGRARGAWLYLGSWVVVAAGIVATACAMALVDPSVHGGFVTRVHCRVGEGCTAIASHGARADAWWVLLGLLGLVGLRSVVHLVRSPAEGRALLPLLGATGKAQLRTGLWFALGILVTSAHWPN